jgi:hypothetical protein
VKRKVLSQKDRSVVDDIGGRTVRIASSKAHSSELGFLALKIEDFATESTLLDPLAKSVLQWRDGVSAILTWTITNSWCIPPG